MSTSDAHNLPTLMLGMEIFCLIVNLGGMTCSGALGETLKTFSHKNKLGTKSSFEGSSSTLGRAITLSVSHFFVPAMVLEERKSTFPYILTGNARSPPKTAVALPHWLSKPTIMWKRSLGSIRLNTTTPWGMKICGLQGYRLALGIGLPEWCDSGSKQVTL